MRKIELIYKEKGLNGVNNYLKRKGIKHKKTVYEFGLQGNKSAQEEKLNFLSTKEKNIYYFHYYCISVKSRKNGYGYNKLRGIKIEILK